MKLTENGIWNKLDLLSSQPALSYLFSNGMRIEDNDEKNASLPSCQRISSQEIFSKTKRKWWIIKHKNGWQVAFSICSLLELAKLSPSPSTLYHQTGPVWFSLSKPKTFQLMEFSLKSVASQVLIYSSLQVISLMHICFEPLTTSISVFSLVLIAHGIYPAGVWVEKC